MINVVDLIRDKYLWTRLFNMIYYDRWILYNLFRYCNFGDEYLYVGMIPTSYSYCASAFLYNSFEGPSWVHLQMIQNLFLFIAFGTENVLIIMLW